MFRAAQVSGMVWRESSKTPDTLACVDFSVISLPLNKRENRGQPQLKPKIPEKNREKWAQLIAGTGCG
jgi:hypothetical protein